ncbi:MAG: hypothetical protein F6J93_22745 [Oscillatoria sp. SIO1A7]|nr:hypothetical protein [Oscillatoria sp. SIO1A7]
MIFITNYQQSQAVMRSPTGAFYSTTHPWERTVTNRAYMAFDGRTLADCSAVTANSLLL